MDLFTEATPPQVSLRSLELKPESCGFWKGRLVSPVTVLRDRGSVFTLTVQVSVFVSLFGWDTAVTFGSWWILVQRRGEGLMEGAGGGSGPARSPVEGAGQEVGGSAQPARPVLAWSHTAHCFVWLLWRTFVFRQIVWKIHVLLHLHWTVLHQRDQNLRTPTVKTCYRYKFNIPDWQQRAGEMGLLDPQTHRI